MIKNIVDSQQLPTGVDLTAAPQNTNLALISADGTAHAQGAPYQKRGGVLCLYYDGFWRPSLMNADKFTYRIATCEIIGGPA